MATFQIWRSDNAVLIRDSGGGEITIAAEDVSALVEKLGGERKARSGGAKTQWTPERDAKLRELYLVDGLSTPEIGELLGATGTAIRARVSRLGLSNRRPDAAEMMRQRHAANRAA